MSTKKETAETLARAHFSVEPEIVAIHRVVANERDEEQPTEPVKLLEVNRRTPPAGVLPVHFGPAPDIHYASVVIEVTPEEYESLKRGELQLPADWSLGDELRRAS